MKLVKFPDPVLKQIAVPWDFEKDPDAKDLEVDMVQLMINSNGIGLAGNQVGILKRVFAIHLKGQVPFCMFNPYILYGDNDMVESEEGCLSFPELFLKVPRHNNITVGYLDRQGNECIIQLTGIDSRCFQHELDHLDGVCFIDNISPLKLALAKKKLLKRKGKRNGRTK
jgi:peptide deformylase